MHRHKNPTAFTITAYLHISIIITPTYVHHTHNTCIRFAHTSLYALLVSVTLAHVWLQLIIFLITPYHIHHNFLPYPSLPLQFTILNIHLPHAAHACSHLIICIPTPHHTFYHTSHSSPSVCCGLHHIPLLPPLNFIILTMKPHNLTILFITELHYTYHHITPHLHHKTSLYSPPHPTTFTIRPILFTIECNHTHHPTTPSSLYSPSHLTIPHHIPPRLATSRSP